MARISREEILKLARAANIHLTEDEIPQLLHRLESVLSYASYLKEVADEHEGAQLTTLYNVVREDAAVQQSSESLLELAPEREGNFYVVPVILKQ